MAQIAIGVLLVIVVRALSEIARLYDPAEPSIKPEFFVYYFGAIAAAVAAIFVLILHAINRNGAAIALTAATIIALFVYKVVAIM